MIPNQTHKERSGPEFLVADFLARNSRGQDWKLARRRLPFRSLTSVSDGAQGAECARRMLAEIQDHRRQRNQSQ
jgi:hypothetical protein